MQNEPSKPTSHQKAETPAGVILPKGFPGLPGGWKSEWETFQSYNDRVRLFGGLHHKEPWTLPRLLIVVHGLGEHSGRYLHVPHYLQNVVDAVYVYDQQGHGRSEGLRGHVERFDDFADDLAKVVEHWHNVLRSKFGSSEIHLLGHSFGGHVVLRTLFSYAQLPVASVTCTAPFLGIAAKVPAAKKIAAKALARVWGTLQLNTDLDPGLICRDPEVVKAYASDRLVHGKMTPKFYQLLQQAFEDTLSRDSGINHPLQFLIPLADQVVDESKALRFFEQLKLKDKKLKTFPEFFHEPLNEIGKEAVFAEVCSWISNHRNPSND